VLQDLISAADYPASALAMRAEGRVWFILTIGINGRVADCAITASSGSRALDSATCRLVRARGRFTPAIDTNGMPAVGMIEDALEWRLPS
jgi:protein TonB